MYQQGCTALGRVCHDLPAVFKGPSCMCKCVCMYVIIHMRAFAYVLQVCLCARCVCA